MTWRNKLYDCAELGFPLFARLRLIKEAMGYPREASSADFARVISFGLRADESEAPAGMKRVAEPTVKNLLAGTVTGNPAVSVNGSVIRPSYTENLEAYLASRGRALPEGIWSRRMDEEAFVSLVAAWRSHFIMRAEAEVGPAGVPNTPGLEPRWSAAGDAYKNKLGVWMAARAKAAARHAANPALRMDRAPREAPTPPGWDKRLEAQPSIGIFAPTRYGKTELVSRWVRENEIDDVCWLDCRSYTSHEFLIDALLACLYARQQVNAYASGYVNAHVEDKKRRIAELLKRSAHCLLVFDSIESLFFDVGALPSDFGDLGERPIDPMSIEFLNELIEQELVPLLFISQNSLSSLSGLRWVELKEPVWEPTSAADQFPVSNLSQAELDRMVCPPPAVSSRTSLNAEAIVAAVLERLSEDQRQLFAFMVLIGERVRYSTLRWFCIDHLGVASSNVDAYLDGFWRACKACQVDAVTLYCDVEHDRVDESDSVDAGLHFKFHDTITEIAAQWLETEGDPRFTSEIHLKIAERSRSTMRDQKYYAARNVVGRLTRPAQLVKHLAASVTADEVRLVLSEREDTAFLIPPQASLGRDREQLERRSQAWEMSGIFLPSSKVEDRYLYAFDLIYCGIIDRTHQLSRVNGADSTKVDLLRRFFPALDHDTGLLTVPKHARAQFPPLPVNLLVELLAAMAVAGLNAGRLPLAKWASEVALDVLADWKRHFGVSQEQQQMFAFMIRVRVDILTRAGDLNPANNLCCASLQFGSEYLEAASAQAVQQLQLRYAHITYLNTSASAAIKYLKSIGLDVPKDETAPSASAGLELEGLSARIWVSLLLKTLRGGGRTNEQDADMLRWADQLLEANWAKTKSRSNERVALMVQRSIIDRISKDAVSSYKRDIIDYARLPDCRARLKEAEILAWNAGVSPATRIELELEIAKVEYLLGNHGEALELAKKLEHSTAMSGYRIYLYEATLLHAEILRAIGEQKQEATGLDEKAIPEFSEAERRLFSLVQLENDTAYYSAHAIRTMVIVGVFPTKQRVV